MKFFHSNLYKLAILIVFSMTLINCDHLRDNPCLNRNCDAIDQEMADVMINYSIPAVQGVILKKQAGVWDIAWEDAYGLREIETNKPAELDTIFPIASAAKLFTGAAIMQLVQQGLVDLDEDINTYLLDPEDDPYTFRNPQFPEIPITVRHLLSHRSGVTYEGYPFLTNYIVLDSPSPYSTNNGIEFLTFEDLDDAKSFMTMPTNYAWDHSENEYYRPGEKMIYSNLGYILASLIIPRVTEYETWKHYVKDNILDPLGMTRTRFYYSDYIGIDGPTEDDINRTSGYVERAFPEYNSVFYPIDPVKHAYEYLQIASAAGCMFSTAREMSYFLTIHLNDGKGYARDSNGNIIYSDSKPVEVEILDSDHIDLMHKNYFGDDPEFIDNELYKKKTWTDKAFCIGWSRRVFASHYMSFNWHNTNTQYKVDWDALTAAGILPELYNDGYKGLEVRGHAGNIRTGSAMVYSIDIEKDGDTENDVAFVLLRNECGGASDEKRDESVLQPERFSFFPNEMYGSQFYHPRMKQPEMLHVILKRILSLN